MYLETFEKNMLNIMRNTLKSKNIKEYQIIKYKFDSGDTVKLRVKNGKIFKIEAKGSNAEKILDISQKKQKNV